MSAPRPKRISLASMVSTSKRTASLGAPVPAGHAISGAVTSRSTPGPTPRQSPLRADSGIGVVGPVMHPDQRDPLCGDRRGQQFGLNPTSPQRAHSPPCAEGLNRRGSQARAITPLFRAQAECWWARTKLESMLKVHSTFPTESSSTITSSRMRSQVPSEVQIRRRSCAVFHGP